jgi:hypothetical protein
VSYATVLAGLTERLETLTGLKVVLEYVPKTILTTPLAYSVLESVDIRQSGQVTTREYRIQHRIVFAWVDNEGAELELIPYVDSVEAAVRADPHLGGRINSGYAEIAEINGGWATIGNIDYRVLDCYSHVVVKE